jgi:hypothetical protein
MQIFHNIWLGNIYPSICCWNTNLIKKNHDNQFSIQSFQIHTIDVDVHTYLKANSLCCRLY